MLWARREKLTEPLVPTPGVSSPQEIAEPASQSRNWVGERVMKARGDQRVREETTAESQVPPGPILPCAGPVGGTALILRF